MWSKSREPNFVREPTSNPRESPMSLPKGRPSTFTQAIPESVLNEMQFDLKPITVPITLGTEKFWLHEASEAAVIAYRNAGINGVQLNEDGKPSKITDVGSSDSVLLCQCFYMAAPDGTFPYKGGEPNPANLVPLERIRGLPSRVTKPIVARLKTISELDQDEEEEELLKKINELNRKLTKVQGKKAALGNVPNATTDTSV